MKKRTDKTSVEEITDYQKLTEQIARGAGLQLDGTSYFDPIYQISMQRDFFKGVKGSRSGLMKALIGLFFFIIPASIALFSMGKSLVVEFDVAVLGVFVFSSVYFFVGIAIIRGSNQKSSEKTVSL